MLSRQAPRETLDIRSLDLARKNTYTTDINTQDRFSLRSALIPLPETNEIESSRKLCLSQEELVTKHIIHMLPSHSGGCSYATLS